ncbi:hypothetical protein GcC1_174014, partial [Golovinomyces cichoracearum]
FVSSKKYSIHSSIRRNKVIPRDLERLFLAQPPSRQGQIKQNKAHETSLVYEEVSLTNTSDTLRRK